MLLTYPCAHDLAFLTWLETSSGFCELCISELLLRIVRAILLFEEAISVSELSVELEAFFRASILSERPRRTLGLLIFSDSITTVELPASCKLKSLILSVALTFVCI